MTTPPKASPKLPFEGLKVVELGTVIAGPFAASLLADLGASVIKIEAPGAGDALRHMGPSKDGVPIWWGVSARAKRCVVLDLKSEDGMAILRRMIGEADVLIENFRPGVLDRLGIGWQALNQLNPRLILLSISGFGNTGPQSQRPGFGKIAESISGLVELTGRSDERPLFVGYSLADTSAGLFGALGVAVALYSRDVLDGTGTRIDLALYEPILRMVDRQFVERARRGSGPTRGGTQDPYSYGHADGTRPLFRTVRSQDGDWLMVMVDPDKMGAVSELVASPDLARDGGLAEWTSSRSTADIREAVLAAGAAIVPVLDGAAIAAMPYFRDRGDVREVSPSEIGAFQTPGFSGYPGGPHRPPFRAPASGADTDVVLEQLGISAADVDDLRNRGVV